MDQTNERLVFDRIVQNCCCEKEAKSQYFLVTPKLLQGLRSIDNDHVTVLLVLNGPGISNKWQLRPILDKLRGNSGAKAGNIVEEEQQQQQQQQQQQDEEEEDDEEEEEEEEEEERGRSRKRSSRAVEGTRKRVKK